MYEYEAPRKRSRASVKDAAKRSLLERLRARSLAARTGTSATDVSDEEAAEQSDLRAMRDALYRRD